MDKHNDDVAARGPDLTEQDYDNFGPASDDELNALHERIVANVTQTEDNMDDTTIEAVVENETTDEDAKREAAQQERERVYREEREAYNVKDKAFGFEVAKLINANLTKLKYGNAKVTGAWANENGNIVVTTASEHTITVHGYGEKYYHWTVDAAILQHAVKLGHQPTDWSYSSDAGKFSACNKCNALARITSDNEIVAAMYMSACPGKR